MIEALAKDWEIITPDGKVCKVFNLKDFCKKNNLNSGHMYSVASGKLKHHKGFKCKEVTY